jgi:prepilin-type N-terminal cleavage/methylation domain-containing protein
MRKRDLKATGFTAIELLIVLSILGIIVVSLAPGLRRSLRNTAQEQGFSEDQIRQKKTIADMRNTGTALLSWLTDEVGAAAAGSDSTIDLRDYPAIRREDLVTILSPAYLQEVPDVDGWGNAYEYALNVEDPLVKQVMAIRSPGRDGFTDADVYTVTSFDPDDFDQDIVWADGFFVRWPQQD